MIKKIILFSLLILISGCSSSAKYNKINYKEALSIIKEYDEVIIDVREDNEYNDRHIESAINVSVNNMEKVNNLIKDKNTHIIVYCLSGVRSRAAYDKLIDMGYVNVYDFGEITNWEGNYEG